MSDDNRLLRMKAEVFKALGHPIRLALAEALRDGPMCVCDLAALAGAERSNVSRHLSMMVGAGLLTSEKRGLMVFYSLRAPCVLSALTCIEGVLREKLTDSRHALEHL